MGRPGAGIASDCGFIVRLDLGCVNGTETIILGRERTAEPKGGRV